MHNTISISDIARLSGISRSQLYRYIEATPLPEPVFRHKVLTCYDPAAVGDWLDGVMGGKHAAKFRLALTEK